MKHARWGDNDRYFGPFTYSPRSAYTSLAVVLSSGGDGDYNDGPCNLRICAFGYAFIVVLPQIVPTYKEKIIADNWDEATVKRIGRNWYYDVHPREYGFTYCDGHLSLMFGRQTHDSSTDQRWGYFLPWTQWRHVRRSLYDLYGAHFWTEPNRGKVSLGSSDYDVFWRAEMAAKDSCPSATFAFADFDGEMLTAKTRIEEREWRFGTGYFKWLSLFRKPKISRSLDIEFSGETGKRKGSWKGGTIGHSIEMRPGELHEAAFSRYCAEHEMKFIGRAPIDHVWV